MRNNIQNIHEDTKDTWGITHTVRQNFIFVNLTQNTYETQREIMHETYEK